MPRDAARRLKQDVEGAVGDDLRTVVLIIEDGWDGIYLRDDLKEEYTKEEYGETVELFRPTEETRFSSDLTLPLGTRHAAIFSSSSATAERSSRVRRSNTKGPQPSPPPSGRLLASS